MHTSILQGVRAPILAVQVQTHASASDPERLHLPSDQLQAQRNERVRIDHLPITIQIIVMPSTCRQWRKHCCISRASSLDCSTKTYRRLSPVWRLCWNTNTVRSSTVHLMIPSHWNLFARFPPTSQMLVVVRCGWPGSLVRRMMATPWIDIGGRAWKSSPPHVWGIPGSAKKKASMFQPQKVFAAGVGTDADVDDADGGLTFEESMSGAGSLLSLRVVVGR